jgi:hypothetical protein
MSAVGLSVASEYEDKGENHYFDAFKDAHSLANPGRNLGSDPF